MIKKDDSTCPTFLDLWLTDLTDEQRKAPFHIMGLISLMLPLVNLFIEGTPYLACLLAYAIVAVATSAYLWRCSKAYVRLANMELAMFDAMDERSVAVQA